MSYLVLLKKRRRLERRDYNNEEEFLEDYNPRRDGKIVISKKSKRWLERIVEKALKEPGIADAILAAREDPTIRGFLFRERESRRELQHHF